MTSYLQKGSFFFSFKSFLIFGRPSTKFAINPYLIIIFIIKMYQKMFKTLSSWTGCNRIRTHNHLVRKRTLKHLAKLAKWWSCSVSGYLYGAFNCEFLSCHLRVLMHCTDKYSQHSSIIRPDWLNVGCSFTN